MGADMALNIIHIFAVILFSSVAVSSIIAAVTRKNTGDILENLEKEHVIVRMPVVYLWIGAASVMFWMLCLIIIWIDPPWSIGGTWWVQMIFWLFAAFSAAFLLQSLLWSLDVYRSKDYFDHTLFRKRRIRYNEVAYYCEREWLGALYVKLKGNSWMLIDPFSTNLEFFTMMLDKKDVPRGNVKTKNGRAAK